MVFDTNLDLFSFFTKQAPTGYIGILIIIISSFYIINNFKKEIFLYGFFGVLISIGTLFWYIYTREISLDSVITQYFLYPMSLGETRLEWLFPIEFQRFVIRHKLIYLALGVPIYLLIKNISKDILFFLKKKIKFFYYY